VLEGICFAIRDVLEVMEAAGARTAELRAAGGGDLLNQIKADVTGREVLVPRYREAELLGLAIIGACARGKYASYAEAAGVLVRVDGRCRPDRQNAPRYGELFQQYQDSARFACARNPPQADCGGVLGHGRGV
jgi:sugar (pentulose or hexulose) kinase